VAPGTSPGATRHAAVPVNPYDPLMFGGSAATLPAQVNATVDIANASARDMEILPGIAKIVARKS